MADEKKFVELSNARLEEQLRVMEQIHADGVCPFCAENLHKYHKEPILNQGNFWVVTKNQWPYNEAKYHFLAISKDHTESLSDLSPEASAELITLFQEIIQKFEVRGGTLAIRFGAENYASSVHHLHAHLIVPDVDDPNHKGMKFPMSKSKVKEN